MKSTKKFSGTHVAEPKVLNDYSKMKLSDMTIIPFQNPNNFDYESLYSIIQIQISMMVKTMNSTKYVKSIAEETGYTI